MSSECNRSANTIFLFAVCLMTTEHFFKFLVDIPLLEYIFTLTGRCAFPFFSVLASFNLIENTSSKKKYIFRVFVIAVLSQPAFGLVSGYEVYNVCFSLALGLAFSHLYATCGCDLFRACVVAFFISLSVALNGFIEYGLFGVLLTFLSSRVFCNKFPPLLLLSCAACGAFLNFGNGLQMFISSTATVLAVTFLKYDLLPFDFIKIPSLIRRQWYPIHLSIIAIISGL